MSAQTYIGEFPVDISTCEEYLNYTPKDWALLWIMKYGSIDGDHHKTWVIDQVAQILHGTPVIVTEARWTDHKPEYRICLGEPTEAYHKWVAECKDGEDGPNTYDYDQGIAP